MGVHDFDHLYDPVGYYVKHKFDWPRRIEGGRLLTEEQDRDLVERVRAKRERKRREEERRNNPGRFPLS